MNRETITSTSSQQTRAWAEQWAQTLAPNTVLALYGEMGAGKTCLVQGLAAGLCVRQSVSSPTYTLVNEYAGSLPLFHIDLYRLRGAQEALALGLEDYLEDTRGVTAIEWAERADELLPEHTIRIYLQHGSGEGERTIEVCRPVDRGERKR